MAEVIFRTKLKRLTNASHYALAEQILKSINAEYGVASHMQHSLTLLQNAITEEKNYIYKVTDTNQSERLQELISIQNKYFTSISFILKTFSEFPPEESYRANADMLYSQYKAHMSKRENKTIGDWIGSAKALCAIWSTNESKQAFDAIQLTHIFEKINSNQYVIDDFYAKYLRDVAERGYSKSAYYRTNTDKYMAIVCSDLHVQTINSDSNIARMAEALIEGLNAMINRFGGHRSDDSQSEPSDVEPMSSNDAEVSSFSAIEDEEKSMKEMNNDQQVMQTGNASKINSISNGYDELIE